MFYVPILGRLRLQDYFRLLLAFIVLLLEPLFRFVFAILPPLKWLVESARTKIPLFKPYEPTENTADAKIRESALANLSSTEDFIRFWNFPFQPHYVTTRDGFILSLHRIPFSRQENQRRTLGLSKKKSQMSIDSVTWTNRPVVLLWHGFLMCSEVWVATPDPMESLAFTLADAGYDVWLGNTRGNKYSCKNRKLKPSQEEFWDFSMDELARYDLPDAVNYILKITGAPSLSYIGFSQGTAQGFSALSIDADLNKKINLFIALAPATKPLKLKNGTVQSLINTTPEVIYLLFGKKSLLSSAYFWANVLTDNTFAHVIDIAIFGLFAWNSRFMDSKNIIYRHLYSYSSVKIVVHWFQIIKSKRFQMYDDSPSIVTTPQQTGVPRYPTELIQTPIALFHGGEDTLPDIPFILQNIQEPVLQLEIEEYEHLQFLWGRGQSKTVFPAILGLLAEYSQVWADAQESESDEPELCRTVPWIAIDDIEALLALGQRRENGKLVGSKISVAKALEHGRVNLDDHATVNQPRVYPEQRFQRDLEEHFEDAQEYVD
ncbi:Alpha/Beta hydrolase protein [Gorgonomyces haynaldii]|nr:Alpha/Beta hydrolase protein [Gorgonomyces haynaldii]